MNNIIGKSLKKLGIKEWVSGEEIKKLGISEYSKYIKYSPQYCLLPAKEVFRELVEILKDYNPITKYSIYKDFGIIKIFKDKYQIIVVVENSNDKSRALRVILSLRETGSPFFYNFSLFRRIHRGNFDFEQFKKDLRNFIVENMKEENFKKLVTFWEQLKVAKISFNEILQLYPDPNKTQQEILFTIRAIFNFRKIDELDNITREEIYNTRVPILKILNALYSNYFNHYRSKIPTLQNFSKELIKRLINIGILAGL